MTVQVSLLVDPANPDGAEPAFTRILECITNSVYSIHIHMFVWRADEIGNRIAQALLDAANRGVRIHIIKDTDALLYECIEMNRKPMFNTMLTLRKQWQFKLMSVTFPDTYNNDSYDDETGKRLMTHNNVNMEWVHHTHAKYYIFDNEVMLTGSINIEDRHRNYHDYMLELQGREFIQHFRDRLAGKSAFNKQSDLDFIINRTGNGIAGFEIKPFIVQQLTCAKYSVYIEMAYIGDTDISAAIIKAANRGVEINMLFSREANVGNDINYKSMYDIARQSDINVYITDKMIHSKLMLFDNTTVIVGSANISVYSMQKGAEIDLVIRNNPSFTRTLMEEIQRRIDASVRVTDIKQLTGYNHLLASMQQLHQKLF